MLEALPKRPFFRFEIPVRYRAKSPSITGSMRHWSREFLLPPLVEIDDEPAFADVYLAWNEHHLLAAFHVPNRNGPLKCDAEQWWQNDGVRLCIDTRDTRENKRATRFCHFFYALPTGGGGKQREPVFGLHKMSRAKEPPPAMDARRVEIAAIIDKQGYSLELAIPTPCLHGWDPTEHPRIGVFYKIKDTRLGAQHLSVTDEFGWNVDPSTWATGVLTRG